MRRQADTTDTAQAHDRPATEDELGRGLMAGGLAGQLIAVHERDPTPSFALHVAGSGERESRRW